MNLQTEPMRLEITWAGKEWLLDTRRVLVNPAEKILILSDIHIGYYSSFRAKGSYLPTYDAEILHHSIESLLKDYNGYHWVLAGDIKHNHQKKLSEAEYAELRSILQKIQSHARISIVLGNHDRGLEQVLQEINFTCEIQESIEFEDFTITHNQDFINQPHKGNFVIGHFHPILSTDLLKGTIVPIFAIAKDLIILPAFNYVAGGFNIRKLYQQPTNKKNFTIYALGKQIYDLGLLEAIPR